MQLSGTLILIVLFRHVSGEVPTVDHIAPSLIQDEPDSRKLSDSTFWRLWRRGKRAIKEEAVNAARDVLLNDRH